MTDKPRFFVEGYGNAYYVMARNNRTVCRCYSKRTANLITKLLIANAEKQEHYAEVPSDA